VDEAEDFDPFAPDETVVVIGIPKALEPARKKKPKARTPTRRRSR